MMAIVWCNIDGGEIMRDNKLTRLLKIPTLVLALVAALVLTRVMDPQAAAQGSSSGLDATATAQDSYAIVDTGQDTCYNDASSIACPSAGEAFFGQDAQFDGNQPNYTLSGDGLTVYDNVTGLTWTRSPDLDGDGDIDIDDKLSFDDAQTYPDTLRAQNYGGYSDWRLPTMKELYSLMDFRGTDPSGPNTSGLTPFIDITYFDFAYGDTNAGERDIDAQFWSSNAYVGSVFVSQSAAFGLNLADGRIKGYPSGTGGRITKLNYVYFVRGNTDYGVNSFVDNCDGTVTDSATGLMWSQDDSGIGMNWQDALAWVQQKNDENYLGHSDWRLPNAKGMQSIVDYSRAPDATSSAAIDPVFNITEITNEGGEVDYPWFWTGTTHVRSDGSGSAGVYICFGRAMGYMNGSWMDVHGAGAQRSDQKGGDFTGYTYEPDGYYFARSPQGDATRIYIYVRAMRDAETSSSDPDTPTPTSTDVPTSTAIPTSTATSTATPTPTATMTRELPNTPSPTATVTATDTDTESRAVQVYLPVVTWYSSGRSDLQDTATPEADTGTPTPTSTTAPTSRPTSTAVPSSTASPTASPIPTPTATTEPGQELNLFAPLRSTTTYLMDNSGSIAHTWVSNYFPGNSVYLLESGNLLRTGTTNSQSFDAGGAGGVLQEIASHGSVIWEFTYSSDQVRQHHDVEPLPSGNVLMIAWELKTEAEAIAAGRSPACSARGSCGPITSSSWIPRVVPRSGSGMSGIISSKMSIPLR